MYPRLNDKEFIVDAILKANDSKEVRRMAMYVLFHILHRGNLTPPKTKAALARMSRAFRSVI